MVDPKFAKEQLVLLLREWYMHPNGQLPAYEWAFGDVNPPVHAWAAMRVYQIERRATGAAISSSSSASSTNCSQLHLVGEPQGRRGHNVFQGGFLGLDNIGVFDRSEALPERRAARAERRHELDGDVLPQHAGDRARAGAAGRDLRGRRDQVPRALLPHRLRDQRSREAVGEDDADLWDNEDEFYYDLLRLPGGSKTYMRVRSMVGLIPLLAVETIDPDLFEQVAELSRATRVVPAQPGRYGRRRGLGHADRANPCDRLFAIVSAPRLRAILARMLDESEFLSPHGLRRCRAGTPIIRSVSTSTATDLGEVDYEPASRAADCSAATPIGAGRCGSRSTT